MKINFTNDDQLINNELEARNWGVVLGHLGMIALSTMASLYAMKLNKENAILKKGLLNALDGDVTITEVDGEGRKVA